MADRPGSSGDEERVEPARDARHELARRINPVYAQGEPVKVGWAPNQPQGELLQGLLIEHGIPSLLRRSVGVDVPDFLAAGARDLLVPESAVEAARAILADSGAEPEPERPPRLPAGPGGAREVGIPLALAVALLVVALALVALAWLLAGA